MILFFSPYVKKNVPPANPSAISLWQPEFYFTNSIRKSTGKNFARIRKPFISGPYTETLCPCFASTNA